MKSSTIAYVTCFFNGLKLLDQHSPASVAPNRLRKGTASMEN